jgi:galactose-1-phosphate uridylyltransferase
VYANFWLGKCGRYGLIFTDFLLRRYELMAEAQRDLTAEQAAARLRGLSSKHFLE